MGSPGGGTHPGLGGGTLKIVATNIIHNEGRISANGAPATDNNSGGGSGGSLSIDTFRIEGFGSVEVRMETFQIKHLFLITMSYFPSALSFINSHIKYIFTNIYIFMCQSIGGGAFGRGGGGSGGRMAIRMTEDNFLGQYLTSGGDGGIAVDRSEGRGSAGTTYLFQRQDVDANGTIITEEKETLVINNKESKYWRSGKPEVRILHYTLTYHLHTE